MDRSVAQGRPADPDGPGRSLGSAVGRWLSIATGVVLALAALFVYLATRTDRYYDHFVWQAAAFLEGQVAIRYPVSETVRRPRQLVLPGRPAGRREDGVRRGLLPFPPLPALVLLPFVALWGLATDDQTIFTILAAIDVAICWWMLGGLPDPTGRPLATTVFFAFGTVFWYTAQLATTWYQAHVVAVGLTLLAVGLALRLDPAAGRRGARLRRPATGSRPPSPTATWRDRLIGRPAAVRRRAAVRARRDRAPDGRVRGAVLHARRRRRRWWADGLVGGPRGALIPVGLLARLQPRDDRVRSSTRPTTTCTGSRPPATPRSATTPTGRSRIRATCPRTRRSCSCRRRTSFPTTLPDALGIRDGRCAPARRRPRPVRQGVPARRAASTSG